MLAVAENPRVHLGANNPPPETPAAFEAIRAHIDDLFDEAKLWFDGAAIETQGQADKVQELLRMMQEAHNAADAERVKENEPFDAGKALVQERFAPLIADTKKQTGKTVKAIAACKAALTAWLRKQEAQRQADAKRLREEADATALAAREALQAAHADNNLEAQEQAEEVIAAARNADIQARRIESSKAQAVGVGRAVGLRDNWVTTLTDAKAALVHYMAADPDALRAWLLERGRVDVRNGRRTIPGFAIVNEPVAV